MMLPPGLTATAHWLTSAATCTAAFSALPRGSNRRTKTCGTGKSLGTGAAYSLPHGVDGRHRRRVGRTGRGRGDVERPTGGLAGVGPDRERQHQRGAGPPGVGRGRLDLIGHTGGARVRCAPESAGVVDVKPGGQ